MQFTTRPAAPPIILSGMKVLNVNQPPRFSAPLMRPEPTSKQPGDLFEISGETRGQRVTAGFKAGAEELVDRALPIAGAMLAGTKGLVGGALAVGAKDVITGKSLGRAALSAVGAGLGGYATLYLSNVLANATGIPALPIAATVVAGTATLAGLAEARKQYFMPSIEVDKERFSELFLDKAEKNLAQAGVQLDVPDRAGLSGKALAEANRNAMLLATMAASQIPGQGPLVWAGEVVQELATANDEKRIDAAQVRLFPDLAPAQVENGVNIRITETHGMSPAMAMSNTVLMDDQFLSEDQATVDFVKGHELSHVNNKDLLARFGEITLIDEVTHGAQELLGSTYEGQMQVGMLQDLLTADSAAISRAKEYRADQEGYDYAVAKGHQPEDIVAGAQDILSGGVSMNHPWSTHPPTHERIDALKKQAGMKTEERPSLEALLLDHLFRVA